MVKELECLVSSQAMLILWRARLEMDAPGLANLSNSIIPVCLITGLVLDTILANKNSGETF